MAATDLTGAVDVCVAVPKLALDRPFTYVLPEGSRAGVGSLVSVPFHGRTVQGWVLGPSGEDHAPMGRLLPVRSVRSAVRFFDEPMLRVLRWVGERYLAPLSTVIERSYPPRVASEEREAEGPAATEMSPSSGPPPAAGTRSFDWPAVLSPGAVSWVRPLPGQETAACVEAVEACLATHRRALVLVPEAEPLPASARAVLSAFGEAAVAFVGGEPRERYGTWLGVRAGRYGVVVGTRPAVFAPLPSLGMIWVSREVHPGHREDRSPYYHVRDVAMGRARIEGAACILASLSPSVDTAAAAAVGEVAVVRPARAVERAAAPLVETVPPEAEDRSARLSALVRRVRSAALILSRRGYGVARVCRACRRSAACHACRGTIVVRSGSPVCVVCGAEGRCANCGAASFGVERGGTERVAEWARRLAPTPVLLAPDGEGHGAGAEPPGGVVRPGADRIVVGTAAAVKDLGPLRLDLVAILDPDRALARSGFRAGEQALATWSEAAAWAGPKPGGGRVLLQTRHPGAAAIQALVRWEPVPFLEAEAAERASAGFPPNHPVFRISGPAGGGLETALGALRPVSLLTSPSPRGTICLVTVRPEDLGALRAAVLRLVAAGTATRVEAEPQL